MSESTEIFGAIKDLRKARRAAFGVPCPQCQIKRPKTNPTILLPQQRCKVDGYRDPRPHLTVEQEAAGLAPYGIKVIDPNLEEQGEE